MALNTINRRDVLKSCGLGMLAAVLPGFRRLAFAQEPVIRVGLNYALGQYFFDPIGLYIPKGRKVLWEFPYATGGGGALMGVTVTAFHPDNENHELRIPETAQPFDSGPLNEQSQGWVRFEWTFDVEGTYDFYSAGHEVLGMVGRIVVGSPGGPAEKFPPGYGARLGRAVVFPAEVAILAACPSDQIVQKKIIPHPKDLVVRPYPYGQR
ncbi:MAG: hypothetical protein HY649_11650 [Acidobacteria bacterium]|nr:hypothetical protein [Acidobacteriota bacterium]